MRTLAFAIAAVAMIGPAAQAELFFFDTEENFLFNAPESLQLESYEELEATCLIDLQTIEVDGFTMDTDTGEPDLSVCDEFGFAVPTDGENYVAVTVAEDGTLTLTFDEPVSWLSFDLIDYGDWNDTGNLTLSLNNDDEDSVIVAVAGEAANEEFIGFFSFTPFTTVVFENTIPGEAYGLDKVRFGPQEPLAACPADLDGNRVVDIGDLLMLLGAWGTTSPAADLTDDGTVNVLDMLEMFGAWGGCPN